MTLVATREVKLVPTDDQTKEIYRREVGDSYAYYFTLADELYTTRESRNLYVYTSWSEKDFSSKMELYDSIGRRYEQMLEAQVQHLTHQGFPTGVQPVDREPSRTSPNAFTRSHQPGVSHMLGQASSNLGTQFPPPPPFSYMSRP